MDIVFLTAMILFVLANLADILTTRLILKTGGTEINPLIGNSPQTYYRMILLKVIWAEVLLIVYVYSFVGFLFFCGYLTGQCWVAAFKNLQEYAMWLRWKEKEAQQKFADELKFTRERFKEPAYPTTAKTIECHAPCRYQKDFKCRYGEYIQVSPDGKCVQHDNSTEPGAVK